MTQALPIERVVSRLHAAGLSPLEVNAISGRSNAHKRLRLALQRIEARTAVLDATGKHVEFYASKSWQVKPAEAAEMIADGRAIFDGPGRIAVTRSPRQLRGWSCNLNGRKIETLAGDRTMFVQLVLSFLLERHPRHQSNRPRPTISESQLAEREREIMSLLRKRAGESDP